MAKIRVVIQKPLDPISLGVQTVTGDGVDNLDPQNPILSFPDTSEVAETTNKKYVTDAEKVVISNTSGTNTGDETTATIQAKRPLKTVNSQSLEGVGNIEISGGGANKIDWEKEEQSITGFIQSSFQQYKKENSPVLLSESDFEALTVYNDSVYIIPQVAKYFGSQLLERYSDIVDDVNDIFVTKLGNDTTGDGTKSLPYLTLAKAFDVASAAGGFTIWIGDGVFAEDVSGTGYFLQTSKAYTSPLVVKSIKGEKPTLTAVSGSFIMRFNGVNDNIVWDGITFQTTPTSVNVFNVSGTSNFNNLHFINCVFKDSNGKDSSISISGNNQSTNVSVKRCVFDSNGDFRVTFQNCTDIDFIGNMMLTTGGTNPKLIRVFTGCSGIININSNSSSLPNQGSTFYCLDLDSPISGGGTVNIIGNKIECAANCIRVKGGTELEPITLNIIFNEIISGENGIDTIEFIDGGVCESNQVTSSGANCIGLPFDATFSGAYSVKNMTINNNIVNGVGVAGHGLLFGERSENQTVFNNYSNTEIDGRHSIVIKGKDHKIYENIFYSGDSDGVYLKGVDNSEVYKNIIICNVVDSNAIRYEPDNSGNLPINNNVHNNKIRVTNGVGVRVNQAASIGDNNIQDNNYFLVENDGVYGSMYSVTANSLDDIRSLWAANYPTGVNNSVNSEDLNNY